MCSSICLKRNQCPAQVMGTNYAICLGKYHLYTHEPSVHHILQYIKSVNPIIITFGNLYIQNLRCHVIDELYDNVTEDSIEMKTIRAVTKLWTNFAKFGYRILKCHANHQVIYV